MVEIVSKRSWDSKVYDTGKKLKGKPVLGTFIQNGIHDIEPDGSFVECDNTLQVHSGNGYSHKAARGRYGMLAMSDNNGLSKQEITLLHKSGNGIKVKYEQSKTYGPFLDNDKTVRYTTDNGATIQQIATYKGCNLILTINNPATSTNEYKFSINPVGNYTYEEQNGNIKCVNDQGDHIYIKATYAKDANNDYGSVSLRLAEKVGNKQFFYKVIDLDWLRNAVGPVECDPTVTIDDDTGTIEDAQLLGANPTFNYGASTTNALRYFTSTNINLGVIKVDLSLYSGTVTNAYFGLDMGAAAIPSTLEWYELYRDWVEGTKVGVAESGSVCFQSAKYLSVDWTTVGARGNGTDRNGTKDGSKALPTIADNNYTVPLTNLLVQKWLDNSADNHGLQLIPIELAGFSASIFQSSETVSGNKPYFYMEYTEGGSRRKKMMGILLR